MCHIGRWDCSSETKTTVINEETIGYCCNPWEIMGNGKSKICSFALFGVYEEKRCFIGASKLFVGIDRNLYIDICTSVRDL